MLFSVITQNWPTAMFWLCEDSLVAVCSSQDSFLCLLVGLMEHTKRLLRAFFELSQTHRGESLWSKSELLNKVWRICLVLLFYLWYWLAKKKNTKQIIFTALNLSQPQCLIYLIGHLKICPSQRLGMFFLSSGYESRRLQPARLLWSLLTLTATLRNMVSSCSRPSNLWVWIQIWLRSTRVHSQHL